MKLLVILLVCQPVGIIPNSSLLWDDVSLHLLGLHTKHQLYIKVGVFREGGTLWRYFMKLFPLL